MIIIAHRCNSLREIRKALDEGADFVEVDLRKRKGEIVLSHDRPPSASAPSLSEVFAEFPSEKFFLEFKEPVRGDFGKAVVISFLFGFISSLPQEKGLILSGSPRYSAQTLKKYGFKWLLFEKESAIHAEEFMTDFKIGVWTVNSDFERYRIYDAVCTDNVKEAVLSLKKS